MCGEIGEIWETPECKMHSILDYIFYLNGTVYKMRIQSGQKKKKKLIIAFFMKLFLWLWLFN